MKAERTVLFLVEKLNCLHLWLNGAGSSQLCCVHALRMSNELPSYHGLSALEIHLKPYSRLSFFADLRKKREKREREQQKR